MSSVNKCIFIGYLVSNPESRAAGLNRVASFRIACIESYTKKNGSVGERAEIIQIVTWNNLADVCDTTLKKGHQVFVEGRYTTESYERNGETRYGTKITASAVQLIGPGNHVDSKEDGFDF